MRGGFYISGTDTGIGKTWASCALLAGLRAHGMRATGMKPVASGCRDTPQGWRNADAEALIAASDPAPTYEDCNPFAFEAAIAPHIAAALVGSQIVLEPILAAHSRLAAHTDRIVVEGVGGWAAPLSDSIMQADLVRALELPVILVVGLRLGCINHALLSARAIAADGCVLAGWIANRIDPAMTQVEENLQTLRQRIAAPLLGVLDYRPEATPEQAGMALMVTSL